MDLLPGNGLVVTGSGLSVPEIGFSLQGIDFFCQETGFCYAKKPTCFARKWTLFVGLFVKSFAAGTLDNGYLRSVSPSTGTIDPILGPNSQSSIYVPNMSSSQ